MRFDSDISTKKMEGGASAMLSVYGCVKSSKIPLLLEVMTLRVSMYLFQTFI